MVKMWMRERRKESKKSPKGIRRKLAYMRETRTPKPDKATMLLIIQPDDYLLLLVAYSPWFCVNVTHGAASQDGGAS